MEQLAASMVQSISDVTVTVVCRRNNNSLANYRPCIWHEGNLLISGSQFSSSQSYGGFSYSIGGGFTVAQVNAMEAGASLTSNFWSSFCTQVVLVVTYVPNPPTVTTNPATLITKHSASLNGTLDVDNGGACDCNFEWGSTTAYGNTTAVQSKTVGQTFTEAITGLAPFTTYHFRAKATNSGGTSYGADQTFTTLWGINGNAYAFGRRNM